jgi:hypothetical protein
MGRGTPANPLGYGQYLDVAWGLKVQQIRAKTGADEMRSDREASIALREPCGDV